MAKAPFINPEATPVPSEMDPEAALSRGVKRDNTKDAATTKMPIQSWNSVTDSEAKNQTPTPVPNTLPDTIGTAGVTGNKPHHDR